MFVQQFQVQELRRQGKDMEKVFGNELKSSFMMANVMEKLAG